MSHNRTSSSNISIKLFGEVSKQTQDVASLLNEIHELKEQLQGSPKDEKIINSCLDLYIQCGDLLMEQEKYDQAKTNYHHGETLIPETHPKKMLLKFKIATANFALDGEELERKFSNMI